MLTYQLRQQTKTVAGVVVPADLDSNGFDALDVDKQDNTFRAERIDAARQVIRRALRKPTGHRASIGSNWVKCRIEERLGYFLAPGELIVAMIGEGFTFERSGNGCYFNLEKDSLRNV